MMFAAAASASKKRLWISTPYLVPDATCINALSMARARGVDVRILVPSVPDQWLVYLAGFYYETTLESLGIPVYRYNRVSSFYFKQLAQEVVRQADGARAIVNELEVEDRTRSATNGQANGESHDCSTGKQGSTEATHEGSDIDCG